MPATRRSANDPIEQRVTTERDEGIVVFLVGMRINALWKVHRWLPLVFLAPRMVRELAADPESGLLGSRTVLGPGVRHVGFVQYWESFEALRAYARDDDRLHRSAWRDYYRNGASEDAAVGIWHETYVVGPDDFETVYSNLPPHGLAASDGSSVVSATDRCETATGRLGRADETDALAEAHEAVRRSIREPR